MARRVRSTEAPRLADAATVPPQNLYYWLLGDVDLPVDAAVKLRREARSIEDLDDRDRFERLYALAERLGHGASVDRQLAELAAKRQRPDGTFLPDVRRVRAV